MSQLAELAADRRGLGPQTGLSGNSANRTIGIIAGPFLNEVSAFYVERDVTLMIHYTRHGPVREGNRQRRREASSGI